MIPDQFWLTDEQFSKIAPHLPTDTRGKARVDDRRVISGIVHVLKSGGRWIDAPPDYGPKKTLYNRYVRWAAKGVWVDLFHALAQAGGPPAQVLIDSLGGEGAPLGQRAAKGGEKSGHRPLARRAHDQNPCADRCAMPPARLHAHRRPGRRLHRRRGTSGAASWLATSCMATRVTTATPSAGRSRIEARCRTSRQRPTDAGRTASRRSSIAIATPSSACSAD